MNTKNIKQKLELNFSENDLIEAIDTNNQGNHFSIVVVSDKFKVIPSILLNLKS